MIDIDLSTFTAAQSNRLSQVLHSMAEAFDHKARRDTLFVGRDIARFLHFQADLIVTGATDDENGLLIPR